MSAKSIIQVDVQDESFRDFYSLYQEYQSHLESMPEDWKAAGDAINDASGAAEEFAEATGNSREAMAIAATQAEIISKEIRKSSEMHRVLLGEIVKNTRAQKDFSDETERGNQSLKKMKEHADGVAGSVFGIGKWLLKLGAWGAGLAGLGGLLSGIGLKDLAESAVGTQQSARGLGMTPGQLTAFRQDFGTTGYLDEGALGSISNAQNSFAGRMWLARASGQSINQVSSEDPGQLAGELAIRAHDWWVNTPENMRTAEALQATGFTQAGFSLPMMKQFGNTPRSELEKAQANYQQDQGKFNVSGGATDAWREFLRQISDAGNTIKTDLTDRLSDLGPDLAHFIDVFSKDAKILIDNILTPQNLKSLENGITDLANYLGSKRFQQDLRDIAGLIGDLAGAMRKAAKFLGIDTGSSKPASGPESIPVNPGLDPDEVQRETRGRVTGFGGISFADKALGYTRHSLNMPSDARRQLAGLDAKNNLPPGTLEAIWAKESSEGKNLIGPVLRNGDQAIGDFQFTGQAWKDWGKGGDRFSFNDESQAAGSYMAFLMKKYKGDVKESLAAYDWGTRNVDKAISRNGANWQNSLPSETRDYINKIAGALKRQPQAVKVVVQNNTSARVAVQANAAAAQ